MLPLYRGRTSIMGVPPKFRGVLLPCSPSVLLEFCPSFTTSTTTVEFGQSSVGVLLSSPSFSRVPLQFHQSSASFAGQFSFSFLVLNLLQFQYNYIVLVPRECCQSHTRVPWEYRGTGSTARVLSESCQSSVGILLIAPKTHPPKNRETVVWLYHESTFPPREKRGLEMWSDTDRATFHRHGRNVDLKCELTLTGPRFTGTGESWIHGQFKF